MARVDDIEKAPIITVTPFPASILPLEQQPPPPPSAVSTCTSLSPLTPPAVHLQPHPPAPEGGLRAWSQVLAGFLLNAVAWGYPTAFGVFQAHFTLPPLDLPPARAAWIGAIQTFLTYFCCTLSGRLSDTGLARPTAAAGSALVVAGTLATSFAEGGGGYAGLLAAQGLCTGLGLGLLTAPSLTAISGYFERRRAVALSISTVGTSFGSALFPAVLQYLMPRVGFAWAVRAEACVVVVLCGVACVLLRPRPGLGVREEGKRDVNEKGEVGMKMCGEGREMRWWQGMVDWEAFREPAYVMFIVASFLIFWALYFGFYYITIYAETTLAFPPTEAATLLILSTALGIPMRPLVGLLADLHLGANNTFLLAVLLLGATHFVWIAVASPAAMYAFAALFGLANGAAQGIWVGALAGLVPEGRRRQSLGTRFGMVCSITAFATLAGPPTASALVERAGGRFLGAQVWAGSVVVLGAGALAVGRVWLVGWRVWVKV